MRNQMTCPYLKEVVMLYCDACPVKKMVPLDHLASASPCLLLDYKGCPLYQELAEKLGAALVDNAFANASNSEGPRTASAAPGGKEALQ